MPPPIASEYLSLFGIRSWPLTALGNAWLFGAVPAAEYGAQLCRNVAYLDPAERDALYQVRQARERVRAVFKNIWSQAAVKLPSSTTVLPGPGRRSVLA
jgi:hypothetical protein